MQLASLTLYSPFGEQKTIRFYLGRLNVITGQSKTGKSMLVKLIDYCLGRSNIPTSAGDAEAALAWVGALWQLDDGGRAFVGRPLPRAAKTNDQVMLVLGGGDLQPPPFEELRPTDNTRTMRLSLGTRIGITESKLDRNRQGLQGPLQANLGHAAFLCLQNQDEISSSTRIFHRSGERGIDEALRDTIPYFLGAIPVDQALQKAFLRQERRRLQRLQRQLADAEDLAKAIDDDLDALLTEAVQAGLIDDVPTTPLTRQQQVLLLHRARQPRADASESGFASNGAASRAITMPDETAVGSSTRSQDIRRREAAMVAVTTDELDQLLAQRALLLDESEGSSAYVDALDVQMGRLTTLNLLAPARDAAGNGAGATNPDGGFASDDVGSPCPVCGETSTNQTPAAAQMREALEQLHDRLEKMRGASPARSTALDDINARILEAQRRVANARQVLEAGLSADATVGTDPDRRSDFTRGRIDATLARVPEADDSRISRLREQIELVEQAVAELQQRLSDEAARELLNARLNGVGRDLTAFAQELQLEHSERGVRIDLSELTVVAEVNDTPVPLHRIGSAENWIGYHIAAHLALHESFIRHQRPVPRLLVIDQPSQGHYPSEVAQRTGKADSDADELAVRRLYKLMDDFTRATEGKFQVIAVDHADIDEDWYQDAIIDNWRGANRKLIPPAWIERLRVER